MSHILRFTPAPLLFDMSFRQENVLYLVLVSAPFVCSKLPRPEARPMHLDKSLSLVS